MADITVFMNNLRERVYNQIGDCNFEWKCSPSFLGYYLILEKEGKWIKRTISSIELMERSPSLITETVKLMMYDLERKVKVGRTLQKLLK